MSSHYKEINNAFEECLGQVGFAAGIAITEAQPIKQLFQSRAMSVSTEDSVAGASFAFKSVYTKHALLSVVNEVLANAKSSVVIDQLQDEEETRLAWKFLSQVVKRDETVTKTIDAALVRSAVHYHYACARPRQFDMFVHLSATEMFFIDGDSLLMAALSYTQVDWDLMQPVHVLYNAQSLLKRLQDRGARFHVVFFDNQQWFWEKAPQKLFIREALRLSLLNVSQSSGGSTLQVECFPSYSSEAFQAYVAKFDPEFILMSDGEQLGTPNELLRMFHNNGEESSASDTAGTKRPYRSLVEDEAHGDKVAFYCRTFLLWATSHHIKVAYSSRIVAKENALIVFAVTVDSNVFARALMLEKSVTQLAQTMESTVSLPALSEDSKAAADVDDLPLPEQVVAGAVHALLHNGTAHSEQTKQLCQALVVCAYAAPLLSVELRAQCVAPSTEVSDFLNTISPYLLQVLLHRGCEKGKGKEYDLWDGHLLCAVVHHLRQTPTAELLDADGTADIDYSWQGIMGSDAPAFTATALSALPTVTFIAPPKAIAYPRFTHELVERLSEKFEVRGHSANKPFPTGFGLANNLSGWAVSHPLDELNDVVDTFAEEERLKTMTDNDKRKAVKLEAAFIKDATVQAESMDIRFTDPIALVCSESSSDEDENEAEGGKKGNANRNKAHSGQRNKKVRGKDEIIREETNLNDANRTVRENYQQMENVLKNAASAKSPDDRMQSISTVQAFLQRLKKSSTFYNKFDPGFTLKDPEGATYDLPLELDMWRIIVGASGMGESEMVYSLDGKSGAATRMTATGAKQTLFVFQIIQSLVEQYVGSPANSSAKGKAAKETVNATWDKLDRLRTSGNGNLTTTYEVAAFLHFVALKYIQYHFECRLMCSIVRLRLENWKEERERARISKEQPNIQVGIPLFLYVHHTVLAMVRNYGIALSVDEVNLLRSALAFFDFPSDYDEKVDRAIAQWQGKPLAVLPATMRPREAIYHESPETMQLMHMGHLLERPIIPQKDYRVVFNPDQWQRDLLDIVDQRGSAVVCAPTSAGKTFISYYCMFSALRTSNTKVVVYVAPNRALINQAVADVCGRYGTKQYMGGGTNVYGVHGGDDYHRFHDKCQVLVTLPEVLETLLLAPKYKEWTKRLDYVILDEIHTMESSGNGDVWERVLALLPCPFVALSATLGETQQLCGWLNRVQNRLEQQEQGPAAVNKQHKSSKKKRDYMVHDIPRSGAIQRWNDIQKHIYLPPPGYAPTLKKLTATYTERHIQDLHPLSILTLDQLRNGFPPDISLVPSEVVQLHERMLSHFNRKVLEMSDDVTAPQGPWATLQIVHDMSAQLASLTPESYFAATNYITQSQARQYEAEVKNAFVYWTILSQTPMQHHRAGNEADVLSAEEASQFSAVMLDLCEGILHTFSQHLYADEVKLEKYAITIATERGEQLQDIKSATAAAATPAAPSAAAGKRIAPAYFPDSKEFIGSNIISVLRELNSRKMGPVIVFSFESEDCDDLVKTVVEQLEAAEAAYRQTEEFAAYKAAMDRKAAAKEAARRQHESNMKQKRLGGVDERGEVTKADRDVDNMENDDEDCEVPDVLPEFTFIGSAVSCHEEVREAIDVCEKRGESLLARAIKRGVGIHHAGVKGKIRRLNEILFRGRHCGVIFATETLALGVHSPCRTVVLAGDHVLLNTTQFRQMMGRAGRRGLDSIGHLVFLSISMKKITRLMTSSMTVIKGNVQLTPVTQLRLLQLYDFMRHRSTAERQSKNAEEWKEYAFQLAERLFVNPLYFQGRETVAGGNMESFSIEFMQMLLGFFQRQGLHFSDRPSSLGTLLVNAMYVFRNAGVGVEGFAFLSMLVRGVFEQADFSGPLAQQLNSTVYPQEPTQESCSEALAEIIAYLFTIHRICGLPLEIHRSALSDPVVTALWGKKPTARQHRVVLAPLHTCIRQAAAGKDTATVLDNAAAFRVISAFYSYLAQQLREEEAAGNAVAPPAGRLPFMKGAKNFVFAKNNKAVEMPLTEKLKATTVPFAARDPFVAISGCGDNFSGVEDLSWTLRSGLLCDRQMLPALDFTDGCRHDGAQVLINACVADFMRCQAQVDSIRSNYRFTLLEELNGLTQSESYAVLSRVEHQLSNLAGLFRQEPLEPMQVLSSLFPEEDGANNTPKYYAGARRVLDFATRLHGLRSQIDKDYSGDQFRLKMETRKKDK